MPPEVGPRVPARVIAPVDDVAGVKPDNDVEKDVTGSAPQLGTPPAMVSTFPLLPAASFANVFTPDA